MKPGYCNRQFKIKWVKPKVEDCPYCKITVHNSHEGHGHHHSHNQGHHGHHGNQY